MKKIFFSTILTLFYFLIPTSSYAVSEFTTSFNSQYIIEQSGSTSVTHTITLKNNLAHIYATDYSLATSGDNLRYITAYDEMGELTTKSTTQNGITTIHLEINHPSIGKDQVKTLTINYQTDDVVERIGDTLTINIPRLERANEAESYTRVVKIEGVEEMPRLIYPPQSKSEADGKYVSYTFVGHGSDSLTLLFGSSVTYKLNLKYELKNKELKAGQSELALPPDTGYQHVLLSSITPPPDSIGIDESGNWLARYTLKPQDRLLVEAELYATVYPVPTLYDPSSSNFQKTPHSKYWDTNSSLVKDLSLQLKTPLNIYSYLISNFTYDYGLQSGSAVRLGATKAISSPSNVLCTEFTDTFVALARALDIPSREINGYGYTKNQLLQPQNIQTDILHAWPEYYDLDSSRWVAIDPTWGNTTGGIDYFSKLDFSHIAFVRHGSEDSYPLPAGAYKSDPKDKYIQVEVATSIPEENTSYEIKKVGSKNVVYNSGNVSLLNQTVTHEGHTYNIKYLPPYGEHYLEGRGELGLWNKFLSWLSKLATWAHIR